LHRAGRGLEVQAGDRMTGRIGYLGIGEAQRAVGLNCFGCVSAGDLGGGGTDVAQFVQQGAHLRAEQQQAYADRKENPTHQCPELSTVQTDNTVTQAFRMRYLSNIEAMEQFLSSTFQGCRAGETAATDLL
jgi:hypothetical protein